MFKETVKVEQNKRMAAAQRPTHSKFPLLVTRCVNLECGKISRLIDAQIAQARWPGRAAQGTSSTCLPLLLN